MSLIDREGTFRADIIEYGLKEQESGSVAVAIQVALLEQWNGDGWDDWKDYGMEAFGDLWIIKKDGTLNQRQVEALVKHCGWDGSFGSIVDRTWSPSLCQVVIKADTYNDETRYKVSWVNDYEKRPGQLGTIDPAKAKDLQVRYGADLRAIVGNAKVNSSKPFGKPAAPSKPSTPKSAAGTNREFQEATAGAEGADQAPF